MLFLPTEYKHPLPFGFTQNHVDCLIPSSKAHFKVKSKTLQATGVDKAAAKAVSSNSRLRSHGVGPRPRSPGLALRSETQPAHSP